MNKFVSGCSGKHYMKTSINYALVIVLAIAFSLTGPPALSQDTPNLIGPSRPTSPVLANRGPIAALIANTNAMSRAAAVVAGKKPLALVNAGNPIWEEGDNLVVTFTGVDLGPQKWETFASATSCNSSIPIDGQVIRLSAMFTDGKTTQTGQIVVCGPNALATTVPSNVFKSGDVVTLSITDGKRSGGQTTFEVRSAVGNQQ